MSVVRGGSTSAAASVSYQTQNGSGASGAIYTATSGTLSWKAGDASAKTVTVPVSKTAFVGVKTFSLVLKNPSGATLGDSTHTVSVQGSASSSPGAVALSAATDSVAQSAGKISISVSRTGGSNGSAGVSFATSDGTAKSGTDYSTASGTLSWASGDAATKSITVSIGTTAFSGSKTFTLTLSKATGATLGSPASATVTIQGGGAASSGSPAAALAKKLNRPARLLIGLGTGGAVSAIQSQGLKVDIYERYLGTGDWTSWNSPPCDYVCVVAKAAVSVGAIPMYTQYQMANNGDGNLADINNSSFMGTYWSRLKLLYTDIAATGKPALVNLEPDFWGYVERQAPNSDPTKLAAIVSSNPDCASLPNNVTGIAQCMIAMARKYAPQAYVGFPPSTWGGDTTAEVVTFMNAVGAQKADFIVEQTGDRDAGCFEVTPQPSECKRSGGPWYWDESNKTHPNFADHLAVASQFHSGIGNLPIIWWQTPLGVPSSTPGGSDYHYRDDKVHYFLTHPSELTAVGGLAVVFGTGENHQTNITTDGGQFQNLNVEYFANPALLP
jgi:hypothetical protein